MTVILLVGLMNLIEMQSETDPANPKRLINMSAFGWLMCRCD